MLTFSVAAEQYSPVNRKVDLVGHCVRVRGMRHRITGASLTRCHLIPGCARRADSSLSSRTATKKNARQSRAFFLLLSYSRHASIRLPLDVLHLCNAVDRVGHRRVGRIGEVQAHRSNHRRAEQ